MKKEVGNKDFNIWLLGDSNPKQWEDVLEYPLDSRHPIRHNIWTSILDYVQDRVYRRIRKRVDSHSLYIRNAVENPDIKPKGNHVDWKTVVGIEINEFKHLLEEYQPKLLFSFGAFSYEFARRSLNRDPKRKYSYWSAKRLGQDFRRSAETFDLSTTNLMPLLHRVVSGGKFVQSQDHFCGEDSVNYFEYVGYLIADLLIENESKVDVWIT